jgi:hypothetical protein
MENNTLCKDIFKEKLQKFLETIASYVSTPNGQWSIKGFIDIYKNIYTISSDTKIVFPYEEYLGHFCFGIIYDRIESEKIDETQSYKIEQLKSIPSVVKNFDFFIAEKWKIASDKSGSGNTANIGSINNIEDIKNENGMFSNLGEEWFDDYWKNYNKIVKPYSRGEKIRNLYDFVAYRKGNSALIVPKRAGRNNA